MPRISPQLIVFSYHKSGTSLFLHVMTKVSERLGLTLANHYGLVNRLEPEPDVVLLPHSLLRAPLDRPYRAIRLIRDPRDIWVSGYLYHMRCDEGWCRNSELDPTPPIGWPQVDYSVAHRPEAWKRRYLERLDGRSYQQNLIDRSPADGLDFELDGYTGCTMATMREWRLNGAKALDMKLEALAADFDGAMGRIFDHFGFTPEQSHAALEVARSEDVRRMDDAAIDNRPQIQSRTLSKWRDVLSSAQIARFEARHGDLIRALGYELSDRRDCTAPNPQRIDAAAVPNSTCSGEAQPIGSRPVGAQTTTRDPGIRLSADGMAIRPTATSEGLYTFVVPPGRQHVRLESRRGVQVDPDACCLSDSRRLGVKVTEVVFRSHTGEIVTAADDPRLASGWHAVERAGSAVWRWTDGSAELPWAGASGPVVVTIRCGTLPEYALHEEIERP